MCTLVTMIIQNHVKLKCLKAFVSFVVNIKLILLTIKY